MAKLRVEAQLTEVALSQGLDPKAGKTADTIKMLGDRAAAAAQNLAMVRLQSDIAFDKQQLGRTDTEQAVAQKLRAAVGTDNVPAAMNSAIGQQLQMLENLKQARDLSVNFATTFASSFSSALQQGASAWQAFKQAGLNALISLQSQLLEIIAKNLMQKAFGSLVGGLGFGSGGIFSGGTKYNLGEGVSGVTGGYALGGIFGNVEKFANGGLVLGPQLFKAANGLGVMGEAGPEAIMPLKRGPDGRLGVSMPEGGGGGGPVVSIQQFFDFRGAENGVEARVRAMSPQIVKQAVDASVKAVAVANRNNPRYLSK
jgi:phage-related minor tail protein